VVRTEPNFRIQLGILVCVIVAGFVFRVSLLEWLAIVMVAGLVVVAEVLNTALEYLADATHPEVDPGIGRAKDASAGAVLVASGAAVVVGLIIFLPKLWQWISTRGGA
jgi:undecaprenol kinase/diacylglycerol kinase (ATP)